MPLVPLFAGPIIAALLATTAARPAEAGERDQLNACKAKVAAQAQATGAADDAALQKCR